MTGWTNMRLATFSTPSSSQGGMVSGRNGSFSDLK